MDGDEFVVEWPSLGFLVDDWIGRHCIIPDGFKKGKPWRSYTWQLWCTLNHYRIGDDPVAAGTEVVDDGEVTLVAGAAAFHNRRTAAVAPQKAGKGPWSATIVAAEGVGPVLFDGWADAGDAYVCAEHGCPCGWVYRYAKGEPRGKPWPTPLIQLLATAEDQVANVWRPLQAMGRSKMLAPIMEVGEDFIRLPNAGLIDKVTSSAQARLGQPITFALQDEAGMGGRTLSTSNIYDPTQESDLQDTMQVASRVGDVFVFWRDPPTELGDYRKKRDRRRIHQFGYKGCDHIDLDAIEAEAAELIETEGHAEAERFFGNRAVAGASHWADAAIVFDPYAKPTDVVRGERIVLGFDGSDGSSDGGKRPADSTFLRACRLSDGYRWTLGKWEHPYVDTPSGPVAADEWYVPRDEVLAAIHDAFSQFHVVLAGFDPPMWRSEIAELQEKYGDDRIIEWRTANDQLMASALERLKLADTCHDGDTDVRRRTRR